MSIIIFILILGALVFVHELGHFLFAKLFNVRVDEFGFGYPPRLAKIGTWKKTEITLNWIPFGGFVKLFGESPENEMSDSDKKDALNYKPKWQQFLVMFGGILFNIIFGWMLLSASYMIGIEASTRNAPQDYEFTNTQLTVTSVLVDSPADISGLQAGDIILEYGTNNESITVANENTESFSSFINSAGIQEEEVYVVVRRGTAVEFFEMDSEEGYVNDRFAIGIGLDRVGTLRLSIFESIKLGLTNTFVFIGAISLGFIDLISGNISLDAVSGPVGIVSQVDQASVFGLSYLVGFMALLSFNLAVLNAFPFPALDGGKILIVIIESIIRRPLPSNVVNWINGIGFLILVGLMILVTIKDVINLF